MPFKLEIQPTRTGKHWNTGRTWWRSSRSVWGTSQNVQGSHQSLGSRSFFFLCSPQWERKRTLMFFVKGYEHSNPSVVPDLDKNLTSGQSVMTTVDSLPLTVLAPPKPHKIWLVARFFLADSPRSTWRIVRGWRFYAVCLLSICVFLSNSFQTNFALL